MCTSGRGDADGGRGRSRSRERGRSRRRSPSSSYSSSSEDSEEREERKRDREARREEREEQRSALKAARKAEREQAQAELEKAQAKAAAEREKAEAEATALQRVGRASWRFVAAGGEDEDEDAFGIQIMGKKPERTFFNFEGIVDCTSWEPLNDYLRLEFNVPKTARLVLRAKLEVDGEGRFQQNVHEGATLANFWANCMGMGSLVVQAQEIAVIVTVQLGRDPKVLAKPKKPRGEKHTADELKFKDLVQEVYGEHPGHYAGGTWTEKATELMQYGDWLSKHKAMAKLTEKVMGDAGYLHNGMFDNFESRAHAGRRHLRCTVHVWQAACSFAHSRATSATAQSIGSTALGASRSCTRTGSSATKTTRPRVCLRGAGAQCSGTAPFQSPS